MKERALQIGISCFACALLVVHLIWPGLKIDAIALTLFAIAIVPWLGSLFKSLELPGGWKFEFKDFAKAVTNAEASGLIKPTKASLESEFQFDPTYSALLDSYPKMAVISLRADIEKRLRALADHNKIPDKKQSATTLVNQLEKRNVLTGQEGEALREILKSLNPVVHGAEISPADAKQVVKSGSQLINSLDQRVL
jgi:hypothetical protein